MTDTSRERKLIFIQKITVARVERETNADDVYYYICWRLKLEGETENMGVCTKERKGVSAEVLKRPKRCRPLDSDSDRVESDSDS